MPCVLKFCLKFCQGYRKYNTDVPHFLVNRPRILVAHCLERISVAKEIENHHIRCADTKKGIFKIKSQSQEGQWYHLCFGDSTKMCSCECQDWQKWWLSCKHFIAVFNYHPGWQWENLSPLYQNSPFFSLDEELITQLQPSQPLQPQSEPPRSDPQQSEPPQSEELDIVSEMPYTPSQVTIHKVGQPFPLRHKYHTSTAAKCRDLRCATFLVQVLMA